MSESFSRLAIINRGEPAMRVINAVEEYNGTFGTDITTIALFTEADRNAMFLEGINTVLKIWESEPPYAIDTKFFGRITTEKAMMPEIGQGIMPKPLQQPHPQIVVTAVAPFSKGVTEAAARGWDPISANFLMPQWVASHWPKYVEGCERAGRPADPANWRVAKSVFVADDLDVVCHVKFSFC